MEQVHEIADRLDVAPTCAAFGVSRASYYRWCERKGEVRERRRSPRALSAEEQEQVVAVLHEPENVDLCPAQVVAKLLDAGQYLCSERTMYRLLEARREVRERRAQLMHPRYEKPQLLARRPNEVWSWDITKLQRR